MDPLHNACVSDSEPLGAEKGSLQQASFPGIIPFGDREQKVTKLAVNYSVSSLVL